MSEVRPLVLLDRDGTLNALVVDPEHGTVDSPLQPSQVQILPGVPEALATLHCAGFVLRIVTNQPASAKGKTTRENLDAVHRRVVELAESGGAKITSSHVCAHREEDRCACRKPRTGLLEAAVREHGGARPATLWMVGDGVNDVQAGVAFGVRTAFLGARKAEIAAVLAEKSATPDLWVDGLAAFAAHATATAADAAKEAFVRSFLDETVALVRALEAVRIEALAEGLAAVRDGGGRLFILGVGGSAGHAGHAVNDFRKLCGFEAYAPTDNVSELTARTNDEGWETVFVEWLVGSRLGPRDGLLVFSVGGGNREKNVSANLVRAIDCAREVGAKVFGIVGRDGGHTARSANAAVVIPPFFAERITPHTEGLCAVIWHLLVSHPRLQRKGTKWESIVRP